LVLFMEVFENSEEFITVFFVLDIYMIMIQIQWIIGRIIMILRAIY